MKSPKQRFCENEARARDWNDFTASTAFEAAAEAALAQLTYELAADPGVVYQAQATAWQLSGARAVLQRLSQLGQKQMVDAKKPYTDLEYERHGVQPGMTPKESENLNIT